MATVRNATVENLIGVEGGTVVTRLTYRGTDTGGLSRDMRRRAESFEFGAIYVWRHSNGKLASCGKKPIESG